MWYIYVGACTYCIYMNIEREEGCFIPPHPLSSTIAAGCHVQYISVGEHGKLQENLPPQKVSFPLKNPSMAFCSLHGSYRYTTPPEKHSSVCLRN